MSDARTSRTDAKSAKARASAKARYSPTHVRKLEKTVRELRAVLMRDARDCRAVLVVANVLRDAVEHIEVALKLSRVPGAW